MLPLCNQTVTAYRNISGEVFRRVVKNCCFQQESLCQEENFGASADRKFLLVVSPGGYVPKIGDRILEGVGPETVEWDSFLPCTVDGLTQVAYVSPWYLGGKLHHIEAGRK